MTGYTITYTRTGSGETKKQDTVTLWENEELVFDHGIETAHNLCEIINLFEIVAAKYWGTYENKNSIQKIEKIEI